MIIHSGTISISDLRDKFKRDQIIVNRKYQRMTGIWPINAKSYFIDSLLVGFSIPKIYLYDTYDQNRLMLIQEIIDGQQRVSAIIEFLDGELRLTSNSVSYGGMRFKDLSEEIKQKFLSTHIPQDTISDADESDILEMFRRFNAYTAPLNAAERRHSSFQGQFKWFITRMVNKYSALLEELNILSARQIIRMGDAELLTDLVSVITHGIVNRESALFNKIYKTHDKSYENERKHERILVDFLETLKNSLCQLKDTYIMKPYVIYSLFCAMTHRKYGIPKGRKILKIDTDNIYYRNLEDTIDALRALAYAHETKDEERNMKEYVKACSSTTHRIAQRTIRAQYLAAALK